MFCCRPGSSRQEEKKAFHKDFEIVRSLPNKAMKAPACALLVRVWESKQPDMAIFFRDHAMVYEWLRVECGAGIPDDNNGEQLYAASAFAL